MRCPRGVSSGNVPSRLSFSSFYWKFVTPRIPASCPETEQPIGRVGVTPSSCVRSGWYGPAIGELADHSCPLSVSSRRSALALLVLLAPTTSCPGKPWLSTSTEAHPGPPSPGVIPTPTPSSMGLNRRRETGWAQDVGAGYAVEVPQLVTFSTSFSSHRSPVAPPQPGQRCLSRPGSPSTERSTWRGSISREVIVTEPSTRLHNVSAVSPSRIESPGLEADMPRRGTTTGGSSPSRNPHSTPLFGAESSHTDAGEVAGCKHNLGYGDCCEFDMTRVTSECSI